MFFLTGGYFVVELVYGIIIGSLALQADAFHMASDLIALVVGFYSLIVARRAPTPIASFGWMRMEVQYFTGPAGCNSLSQPSSDNAAPIPHQVVGALMNGTFLLATCFNITLEAIHRYIVYTHVARQPTSACCDTPPPVVLARFQELDEVKEQLGPQAGLLMKVALIGLAVNVVGLFVFGHGSGGHGHSHGGGGHGHSHGGGSGGHGHSHGGGDSGGKWLAFTCAVARDCC